MRFQLRVGCLRQSGGALRRSLRPRAHYRGRSLRQILKLDGGTAPKRGCCQARDRKSPKSRRCDQALRYWNLEAENVELFLKKKSQKWPPKQKF